jgi:predicted transglutaminase-like cysteine proteinase
MSFWDWLFGTAKIRELEQKIQALNLLIQSYTDENKSLEDELKDTETMLEATLKTVKNLSDEIKFLKEPDFVPKPDWLDENGYVYKPSIKIVEKGSLYNVNIAPEDIYAPSPSLENVIKDHNWRTITNIDELLWQIWSYVTDRVTYAYDQDEGWEYPTTTYYRMKGDCEDSTILFVTICRMCGIKSDGIFNVTGWWKMSDGSLVGHSFPIAKKQDGKWYVYETTLPSINASYQPKLFKGSNYSANWGMANWNYSGGIKNGQNQI